MKKLLLLHSLPLLLLLACGERKQKINEYPKPWIIISKDGYYHGSKDEYMCEYTYVDGIGDKHYFTEFATRHTVGDTLK